MRSIILAAGMGKRLHSAEHDLPKAMHKVNGKPLLEIALESVSFIDKKDTYIVVGYKKEDIINYFGDSYNYCEQLHQNGTGDAVKSVTKDFEGYDGSVIVTFGDMPLFRKKTLEEIVNYHNATSAACTVMTGNCSELKSYGRIIRDNQGKFSKIIEAKDCTPEEYSITEVNSGVAVYDSKILFSILPQLSCENAQHEYYLTEIPALMLKNGYKVELYNVSDPDEMKGVNTPEELEMVSQLLKNREN